MTNIEINNSALLIIDIQEKLLNAVFNKEAVRKNSEILSKAAAVLNLPVIITEQYPKGLGSTVDVIKDNICSDNCEIFEKTDFNALANKNVVAKIKKLKRKNIIICGIETHICVYQTAVSLIERGYNVTLIKNICGSRSEEEYLSALDVLKRNNVEIKTMEMILFEFLKSSKHPSFKEIQGLIK